MIYTQPLDTSDATMYEGVEEEEEVIQSTGNGLFKQIKERGDDQDSCEMFGRYIAAELRAMNSLQSQQWAKLRIQNVLCDHQAHEIPPAAPPAISPAEPYTFSSPHNVLSSPHSSIISWTPEPSPSPDHS